MSAAINFCKSLIDPLDISQARRIVLVDTDQRRGRIQSFQRLIRTWISESYNLLEENKGFRVPIVFLNILGEAHLYLKPSRWNAENELAFAGIHDLVVPGANAFLLVEGSDML